jgi:molecular chaperone GrpE
VEQTEKTTAAQSEAAEANPNDKSNDFQGTADEENGAADQRTVNSSEEEAHTNGAEKALPTDELDQMREQAEEHYQRYLRTQADFDNFRRRSRTEKEEFAKYASMKLIEQLLPIVDNMDRALSSSRDTKDFGALVKGVEMTFRQLEQVLEQEGLKKMDVVGQPFNPEFHQAIMQVDSDEHEEGTVVEEMQKGYILKDKVLRPAMVKVST